MLKIKELKFSCYSGPLSKCNGEHTIILDDNLKCHLLIQLIFNCNETLNLTKLDIIYSNFVKFVEKEYIINQNNKNSFFSHYNSINIEAVLISSFLKEHLYKS
jgi:hypothetical protein